MARCHGSIIELLSEPFDHVAVAVAVNDHVNVNVNVNVNDHVNVNVNDQDHGRQRRGGRSGMGSRPSSTALN